MERILVFSDTHGNTDKALDIFESIPDITAVFHLGDIVRDCQRIEKCIFPVPLYCVTGNNDYAYDYPYELEVEIAGKMFFLTHGHKYGCYMGTERLEELAESNGYDVVLYGHTHIPAFEKINGIIYANPGSLSLPRGGFPSYGIIEIENGKIGYSNISIQ